MHRLVFVLAVLLLVPVLPSSAQEPAERLRSVLADAWEFALRENPLFATSVGDGRYNDRLPDVRPEAQRRRAEERHLLLARLEAIDPETLPDQDRISHRMLVAQLRDALTEYEFRAYEIPILVDAGFHIAFARLPDRMPFASVEDYENYVARLRAYREYTDQHIANMRSGLSRGFTLPGVVLEGYEGTIAGHVVDDPDSSVFAAPFAAFPRGGRRFSRRWSRPTAGSSLS